MRKTLFAVLALGLLPGTMKAQEAQEAQVVERVVAVAGDSIILFTQLQERLLGLVAQGIELPSDSTELQELQIDMLNSLIDEILIAQEAAKDSTIIVDEESVEEAVNDDLAQRVQALGGQQEMTDLLREQGLTLAEFRERLRASARVQQLQSQYLAKAQRNVRAGAVIVTTAEARTFFDEERENLPRRPATLTFRQVVMEPQPSDSAVEATRQEAQRILGLLIEGEDFEALARRVSQDPGTQNLGGDLGWFRRGSGFVKEFEDAAFALRDGDVSDPVRTQFGFHLITVERTRGAERKARHILLRFQIDSTDVERARERAQTVYGRALAGESMEALSEIFGTEGLPDSLSIPTDRLAQLPPGYEAALRGMEAGALIGPIEFATRDATNFSVVKVLEVRDEGEYIFEDLEEQIRARLRQEKLLDLVIQQVRDKAYLDIRM